MALTRRLFLAGVAALPLTRDKVMTTWSTRTSSLTYGKGYQTGGYR